MQQWIDCGRGQLSRSESGCGPLRRAQQDPAGSPGVRLRTAEPLVRGRLIVSPESSTAGAQYGILRGNMLCQTADWCDEAGVVAEVSSHLSDYHDSRSIFDGCPRALFAITNPHDLI